MWSLFIFTSTSNPLPKYVLVFIEDVGENAEYIFKKEIMSDINDYTVSVGRDKHEAYNEALRRGTITMAFTLGQILSLPECKVIPQKITTIYSSSSNGMVCSGCKKHNPYAESNQNDGTFICYNCRNGY